MAERMYVNRSTVARWESGSRLPDAVMISRLSRCLGIDVNTLLSAAAESDDAPNVILVWTTEKYFFPELCRFWKR